MNSEEPTGGTAHDTPSGAAEAEYRSHARDSLNTVLLSLGGLAVCGIAILVGTTRSVKGTSYLLCGIPLALLLLIGGLCGLAYRMIFRTHLGVYENGVLVETTRSQTFTRWEDITAIFEFSMLSDEGEDRFSCGFRRTDGQIFYFHPDVISSLRDFASRLHQRIDARVRADALRALTTGGVAWFGPLGLSRTGFHSHKGVLAWPEVSFVGFSQDFRFEVLKKGSNWSWFSEGIGGVENVAILNELIKSRKEWALPS